MRNVKNLVLLCGTSVVLLTASTGCYMFQGHSGDRTTGRAFDDKTITSAVEHKLKQEPVYKFDDVDVKTFAGVVQLSGFVNTDDQKERAGEIAQHVDGVTRVVNNITLKPSLAPTGQPVPSQPEPQR